MQPRKWLSFALPSLGLWWLSVWNIDYIVTILNILFLLNIWPFEITALSAIEYFYWCCYKRIQVYYTTNAKCTEYHKRMPVLILPEYKEHWFNSNAEQVVPLLGHVNDEIINVCKAD